MLILINLDMTIVNLALPKMAIAFKADINQTQWIITSYLIATALFFTLFGRLADIFGRKRLFLLGVFLFTVGSLFAGFAPSLSWLMLGRFIQGLGFAATLGLTFVIIFLSFPEDQRGLASGLGVGIAGISQALGPTVGGLMVQYVNWPWVFLINVPLGLLSLWMVNHFVPKDKKNDQKKSINIVNTLLFIVGLFSILYVLNQFALLTWLVIVLGLMIGISCIIAFYWTTHRVENPLIHIDVLLHTNFILISCIRFFIMMLFSAILFIIPLYLQNILNFSPERSGLMMLSLTALVAMTSPMTGKLIGLVGYLKPIIVSVGLAMAAIIVSYFTHASTNLLFIFISLGLLGIALGLCIPASIAGVNDMVPEKDAGTAMGLFFTLAIMGAGLGVALVGNLLSTVSASFLMIKLQVSHVPLALLRGASGTDNIQSLPPVWHALATTAFIHAYHAIMLVMLMTMLIASALTYWLYRRVSALPRTHSISVR